LSKKTKNLRYCDFTMVKLSNLRKIGKYGKEIGEIIGKYWKFHIDTASASETGFGKKLS